MIKVVDIEQKIKRNDLIYKTSNKKKHKTYDFQRLKTVRSIL